MPSATAFLDEDAPSASAFLDEAPIPISATEGGPGFTFLPRSGAQMDVAETRPLMQEAAQNPQLGGAFRAAAGAIPTSLDDLTRMATLPREGDFESEQLPQSEEWGKAVRGEYGPAAQAEAITGTLMQGLPLLKVPFAESPLRPNLRDLSLAEQIRQAKAEAETPPPIPPEYAERRFTMQPTPSEAPPQLASAPPVEQTLANMGQPLPFNPELGPVAQPDFQMPLRTETQQFPPPPTPPIGTPLNPKPLYGPPGETAADVAAAQQPFKPVELRSPTEPVGTSMSGEPIHAPEGHGVIWKEPGGMYRLSYGDEHAVRQHQDFDTLAEAQESAQSIGLTEPDKGWFQKMAEVGGIPETKPAAAPAAAPPEVAPPAPPAAPTGTVRIYHGSSMAAPRAGSDFTTSLQYATDYAAKSQGTGGEGRVWYVDVPEGVVKTHDEYGQPMTRVVVPDEIADQARPLEAPSVAAPPEAPLPYTPEAAAARAAEPPAPPVLEVQPETPPAPPGISKIGQSIEAKAVEAKLTKGFAETAGYDPLTIKDQAQRATSVIKSSVPEARAIVRGEAPLPEGLRGTSLITAMEEHLLAHPDAQLAYELANSPLTSATSAAAQEMRLMAERVPDGIAAKFTEIKRARAEGAKLRGETPAKIKADIGKEVVRQASKRPTWEAFVREIVC